MNVQYPWINENNLPDLIRQADVVQMIRIETYFNFKERENMPKTVVRGEKIAIFFASGLLFCFLDFSVNN